MKRCCIISGGEFSNYYVPGQNEYVIACDKGLEWAKRLGVKVDLLIGDFDSYVGTRPEEVETITLPHEKDDTDTNFALKEALKRGFDEIVLVCAMGGRFDHAFSNVQSCRYAAEHGAKICILDEETSFFFVTGEPGGVSEIEIAKDETRAISVYALSDRCSGVNIKGTQYELEDGVLTGDFPIGTSNEWEKETVRFGVKSGTAVMILSKI